MLSLKLSAPTIAALSAGLLALAVYGMSIESRPFLSTTGTAADRLRAVVDAPDLPFLSSKRALGIYDADCRELVLGASSVAISADDLPNARAACLTRLRSAVTAAPANSRMWLSVADLAATLPGQTDLVFAALHRSYATAPWQYALATERRQLIETFPDAPADIKAIADADLLALAASWLGQEDLAKLYVARPDLRDRITSAIETRGDNVKRWFPLLVKKLAP